MLSADRTLGEKKNAPILGFYLRILDPNVVNEDTGIFVVLRTEEFQIRAANTSL